MAIIKKTCSTCKGVRHSMLEYCWRCNGHGYVEHDTTDKYYYGLMIVVVLYMGFQVVRHFL